MIRFFARHPTAGNLLMIVFLVAGLLALPSIQRSTFPDFAPSQVEVRVPYPGATAEEVEEAVCGRVEDALDSVEAVEEVVSDCRENVGIVTVTMDDGRDFVTFVSDVTSAVDGIADFPAETEAPVISRLGATEQVIALAVTGPEDPAELKAYCEGLKDQLSALDDGPQVVVSGFGEHQIRIEARASVLERQGLSIKDLAGIIGRQSVDLPGGTIETTEREIRIRLREERRSPRAFADLIVASSPEGGEVKLADVATITETFHPAENRIVFNGRRAGLLEIKKTKSQDSLRVLAAVEEVVARVRETAPTGVDFQYTEDFTSVLRDRLSMLIKNGWQGLLLVFIAMWVFFGLRYSFWVAMGLPVSFFGALAIMPHLGITVNMLSTVALLLALGLLMDDAIVIAENVATHLRKGKGAVQAAVDGTSEVLVGVVSSFATTLCVLGPLMFLAGDIGKVLYVVPLVLAIVLIVSLVEAFLILPGHLGHALRDFDPDRIGPVQTYATRGMDWLRERVLGPLVDLSVRWRYASLGLAIAAFLLSMGMVAGGRLKFQAFPDLAGDVVQCRILLPQGTPLSRTESVVARVTAAIDQVDTEFAPRQPPGTQLVRNVNVRFNRNIDAKEEGPHVATVSVDLLGAEVRDASTDEVLARWRERVGTVPDALTMRFTEPGAGPAGDAIDIRVQGADLGELEAVASRCLEWLDARAGVVDLSHDLRPGKPEIGVRLRPGANQLGLSAEDLARQIRSALYGATAAEMQVGSESFEVDVRMAGRDKDTLADLEAFRVALPGGLHAPLAAVAWLQQTRGYSRIARVDGVRTVSLVGDVDTSLANTTEVLTQMGTELVPELARAYPGVEIVLEGEMAESAETGNSMATGMLVGMLGVFVLLSFQFRSYLEPLVVMSAIPLALIGVVWGHLLMGKPLTMPSILGFISLAGIVVNDSILLVEFVKIRRRAGQSTGDAARHASRERFRAVLLTTVTTVVGLLPLMSETSLQAQFVIPLAISIVFGIMASTGLVLLLIPALYTMLDDFGLVEDVTVEDAETTPSA